MKKQFIFSNRPLILLLWLTASCLVPIGAGEWYKQRQELHSETGGLAAMPETPGSALTPSEAIATPNEGLNPFGAEVEEAEAETDGAEEALSPDRLNLAFMQSDGAAQSAEATVDAETTDTGAVPLENSIASTLYNRLADKDAAWSAKLYDLYHYTPEQMAAYLNLPPETVSGAYGLIPEFKSLNAGYYNGSGQYVLRLSNTRAIVSMCNVLYSTGIFQDEAELTAYADFLWENSHAFTAQMSGIYYCDGSCKAAGNTTTDSAAETTEGSPTATETAAQTAEAPASHGLNQVIHAETASEAEKICTGHMDLNIRVTVKEAEEKNGLFSLDYEPLLAHEEWTGWNEENKRFINQLLEQDWLELYGINAADLIASHPLSTADIQVYMDMVPEDVSEVRKQFVRYALSSVGKIPYYWGGKPNRPGYQGNQFGTIVAPDKSGRFLKGLDCSGWVSWVYWSVTGQRLGAESTSNLVSAGQPISKEELVAGDICIRQGASAHVVMFLGRAGDGRMYCVQETSAITDNVEIALTDPDWPVYRRILP